MHMKKLIRHRAPRYLVRIPLRFRLLASPEMPEEIAESLNLSARGVSFATRFPLAVGTPIQLSLKVPEEVTGKPTSEWRCRGQVIHTRPIESNPGMVLVGVLIVYYEVVQVAGRRAS